MYTKKKEYISLTIRTLFFVLAVSLSMSSCLSSDSDSTTTTSTCYISDVTFSTMKRNVNGTITTVSTSTWPFTINQRAHTIENRDSLPYGIVTRAMLATITYDGASLTYQQQNAWEGDAWTTYSSTDSIDFSSPLKMRVYATDETYQTYLMKVNVHQIPSDSTTWMEFNSMDDLASAEELGMVSFNDSLVIIVKKADGVTVTKRSEYPDGGRADYKTTLPNSIIPVSLKRNQSELYVATEGDSLYCSTDEGRTWKGIYKSEGFNFAAVSDDKLYGIMNGMFISTEKLGQKLTDADWSPEKDDGKNISEYPWTEIASSYYEQTNGLQRILLTGKNLEGKPVVWSKVWNSREDTEGWVYYPASSDNIYYMPNLNGTNIMRYGDSSIAVGRTDTLTLSGIYSSYDQGISWQTSSSLMWPTDIRDTTSVFATTVCDEDFIWIVVGGRLFRARMNSLGFSD